MSDNYVCSICKKENVKLWRPYMDSFPLICAECAEKLQTIRKVHETIWTKNLDGSYTGKETEKMINLSRWKVNEDGLIPSGISTVPEGEKPIMTDQLTLDLSAHFKNCISGNTTMIPAVPTKDGNFWGYTSTPESDSAWWKNLATR